MKAYTDFLQGSEEWVRVRTGKITASRLQDVLRSSPTAKTRIDYIVELAQERRTGQPAERDGSTVFMKASQHLEPYARRLYEEITGTQVDQYGFVLHPSMDFFGCSPDGVIGLVGGLEIKCPTLERHLEWLRKGEIPTGHQPQMMGNIMCCESEWWDFMSYNPLAEEGEQAFIVRLPRDEKRIDFIDAAVRRLNDEVNEVLERLPEMSLADQLRASLEAE